MKRLTKSIFGEEQPLLFVKKKASRCCSDIPQASFTVATELQQQTETSGYDVNSNSSDLRLLAVFPTSKSSLHFTFTLCRRLPEKVGFLTCSCHFLLHLNVFHSFLTFQVTIKSLNAFRDYQNHILLIDADTLTEVTITAYDSPLMTPPPSETPCRLHILQSQHPCVVKNLFGAPEFEATSVYSGGNTSKLSPFEVNWNRIRGTRMRLR